ncbi:MAG: tetratricopeptide repeat protein [Myxococcaceae bacterium]|jgi:tetratricopeptide (TPR) repeat protein|nr:tetratricopeptide repeat protein [Myxococcaceae bacterium]
MSAPRGLAFFAAFALMACPEERRAEEARQARSAAQLVAEGRAELARNRPERAIARFKEAMSLAPGELDPYLQLAEAYRLAGNEAGAILTLKQAEEVAGGRDPSLKRARADLLLKVHQYKPAITEFLALRDMDVLTDAELRMVAVLLAHEGRIDEAYRTLDPIFARSPDDEATKTVEAEILLIDGREVEAAKLMDRLIDLHPNLTPARVLRARYFRANGQLEAADADLLAVNDADRAAPEVVTARTRVLNDLGRHDEAAQLVEPLLNEDPRAPSLLALLAQTRLRQDRGAEAQALIDRALGENARFAPALTVRGESFEQGGNYDSAIADYETARRSDPTFTPPLSRLWPLYLKLKRSGDAMTTLETLVFLGEATPKEKIELARLYVDSNTDFKRASKLVTEALRRDPRSADLLRLKARIDKALAPKSPGIIIMKHR